MSFADHEARHGAPAPVTSLGFTDQSPLHSGGPVSDHILSVFGPLFWVSVVITAGVSGVIIYSALRFRRQHDDEEPVQVHGNNRLELGWTIIPGVILISLFILTAANMPFISSAPASSMHVNVIGRQFSWSFQYGTKNAAGKELQSGGALYVPAGRPVALTVESVDVNHSLYLPRLSGQINAIPGQTNRMWFQADQVGTYYGQCTELCGVLHWQMTFKVVALRPSAFDQCMSQAQSKSDVAIVNCAGGSA